TLLKSSDPLAVRFDQLCSLSCGDECPLISPCLREVPLQLGEFPGGAGCQLFDEEGDEVEALQSGCRDDVQVVRSQSREEVSEPTVFEKFRAEGRIGAEEQMFPSVDDPPVEVRNRHRW